jgi:catechol 2,3-dioxygenase-like lactoylglutathione lyase family enzyme
VADPQPPLQPAAQTGRLLPTPTNPNAVRSYIYTVVTPDMDASIHFYRDIVGYDLLERGVLDSHVPTVAGAGGAGRAYALLRHNQKEVSEEGVIRLLQAPNGAKANRPRPQSRIVDPGWATIEGHPQDWQAAYHHMLSNNIRTVSGPCYYWGPAQGDALPAHYSVTFSAFGPAGEQMFISAHPNVPQNYTGIIGPLFRHTLMCLDRYPILDFYGKLLGITVGGDDYVGEETLNYKAVNLLAGAPPGSYFRVSRFSALRDEIWEWRQWDPEVAPAWPTALDRTGLAMITLLVDDLAVARGRAKDAGFPILGEGAFPSPGRKTQDGFNLRGGVGELVEVIGRA